LPFFHRHLEAALNGGGEAADMSAIYCFTPDRAFFPPAIRTIASLIEAEPDERLEIALVCEPGDVPAGFDKLARRLRERIELITIDFARYDKNLKTDGRFSRAVFRRLFLDEVLPARFGRIVSIDSDMLIVRPGLARLASFDLAGRPLAAAYDMIFLMDSKRDALARRFQAYRLKLGLGLETPYFNAGLMAIDRAEWRRRALTERVVKALRDTPARFPFNEQSALNATLSGDFAPLSPRFNFMGDFLLIDLERRLEPIVLHFVNAPKPWELALWRGEARFAENSRGWFSGSPWPELAEAPAAPRWRRTRPPLTRLRQDFAKRLSAFLAQAQFIDGSLTFRG
jgi:lipopolysaccharide biosynthesis glycosyltransferase